MSYPRWLQFLMCGTLTIGCTAWSSAAVRLPAVIGNNMVLQRNAPAPIWGWAEGGEEIAVCIAGQTHATKAGDDGRWKVVLERLDAGGPLEMTIQGSSGSRIVLKNILVGEVWLCSGQSNMARGIGMFAGTEEDIKAANYPRIRLLQTLKSTSPEPATDINAAWAPCSPENILAKGSYEGRCGFSATGYYFGRYLHEKLDVPVGLINASVGATAVEVWIGRKALESIPELHPLNCDAPSSHYNGMIAPLMPYAIRGAIWYQGESNVCRPHQYRTLFSTMISNWRVEWGQGDFPFGFAQLSPFDYMKANMAASPEDAAELREAQLMALLSMPNTGMAVTMDIADPTDIHPKNKRDVGKRLALWALAKVYGCDVVYSGPIYKSMCVEGNKVRLHFDHANCGLAASDGKPLAEFTIAGDDRKFVPAVAEIDGQSVVAHSDQVERPVAVRYGWRDDALPNLANKEGLPASPFRTDDWPKK